jgi:hypothetical protein
MLRAVLRDACHGSIALRATSGCDSILSEQVRFATPFRCAAFRIGPSALEHKMNTVVEKFTLFTQPG